MLKYVDTDIVFQEIPDEVTLAVNLSGCPCRCPGCHSKHLWGDGGKELTDETVDELIATVERNITCLSIMGGDSHPDEVNTLAERLRQRHPQLHIAWWSGRTFLAPNINVRNFDYIKLGPYLSHLGPLKSRTTNQRLYRIHDGKLHDITAHFWRNTP